MLRYLSTRTKAYTIDQARHDLSFFNVFTSYDNDSSLRQHEP